MLDPNRFTLSQAKHILVNLTDVNDWMASLETVDVFDTDIGELTSHQVIFQLKQVSKLVDQVNHVFPVFEILPRITGKQALDILIN